MSSKDEKDGAEVLTRIERKAGSLVPALQRSDKACAIRSPTKDGFETMAPLISKDGSLLGANFPFSCFTLRKTDETGVCLFNFEI